jgi:hypothetical protein
MTTIRREKLVTEMDLGCAWDEERSLHCGPKKTFGPPVGMTGLLHFRKKD